MKNKSDKICAHLPMILALFIVGCNSASNTSANSSYKVNGVVSGLSDGEKVILVNNNDITDKVVLGAKDSNFSFRNQIIRGGSYNVTVLEQPANVQAKATEQSQNKICTVKNYSGAGINKDIANINVVCSNQSFTVGGSVFGLPVGKGEEVTLINNGNPENMVVASATNQTFTLPERIARGGNYNITISKQPAMEICTVNNGSGAGMNKNISHINVICNRSSFPISGTVNNLMNGHSLTLINNGDIKNAVTIYGGEVQLPFNFLQRVAFNSKYNITVSTQPENQTCTVVNGMGIAKNYMKNITVRCGNNYNLSGKVTGLQSGQSLTLINNGDINNAVTLSGSNAVIPFTFLQGVVEGADYKVSVSTQPEYEICTVNNGSRTMKNYDVDDINISCTDIVYSIGGSVDGVNPSDNSGGIIITNTNNNDEISISSSGYFTMPQKVADGDSYDLEITPYLDSGWGLIHYSCNVTNGSGLVRNNLANIQIQCSPATWNTGI